jgi:hypothetical protein
VQGEGCWASPVPGAGLMATIQGRGVCGVCVWGGGGLVRARIQGPGLSSPGLQGPYPNPELNP